MPPPLGSFFEANVFLGWAACHIFIKKVAHQIEIMKMFSFFEMETGHTEDLKRAAKQMEHNGREVAIEESSPKPAGAGRERSRKPRGERSDRRDFRGDGARPSSRRSSGGGSRRESSGSHGAKRRRRY